MCRDLDESRELGFPVFSRGGIPVSARNRLQQRSSCEPVSVAGTPVATGDLVRADGTGIVFVPSGRLPEVLELAKAIAAREAAIAQDLRSGSRLSDAMRDARLAGQREVTR